MIRGRSLRFWRIIGSDQRPCSWGGAARKTPQRSRHCSWRSVWGAGWSGAEKHGGRDRHTTGLQQCCCSCDSKQGSLHEENGRKKIELFEVPRQTFILWNFGTRLERKSSMMSTWIFFQGSKAKPFVTQFFFNNTEGCQNLNHKDKVTISLFEVNAPILMILLLGNSNFSNLNYAGVMCEKDWNFTNQQFWISS